MTWTKGENPSGVTTRTGYVVQYFNRENGLWIDLTEEIDDLNEARKRITSDVLVRQRIIEIITGVTVGIVERYDERGRKR